MLNDVRKPMLEKGLSLEVTEAAKAWLGEKGYDPTFGARPLRRLIEQKIEDPLSDDVLSGKFQPGQTVVIDVNEDPELDCLFIKHELEAKAASTEAEAASTTA